jgi:cytochrome c oxidase assembly protein subunit 15
MTRRSTRLAWYAAAATYLLIIFGAIVRITGSGLGCGEHWPLCNGSLLPPLDIPTMIEYGHRLIAAALSVLVVVLALVAWMEGKAGTMAPRPRLMAYASVGLLILQVALGAITVKLSLPAWTVILHLGTAMLLLAALLVVARGDKVLTWKPVAVGAAALGFVTVLMGALTANMGAATACLGFPLCNGQLVPTGDPLAHVHWTHRLLAYALAIYVIVWAVRGKDRGARHVLGLVLLQIGVAAAMVLLALPHVLQAVHVAFGAGIWAGLVLAAL